MANSYTTTSTATGSDYPENNSVSSINDQKNVTVKFSIDDDKIYTQSYNENSSISDLKSLLVNVFNIPTSSMLILYKDEELENDTLLKDLVPISEEIFNVVELQLLSVNPEHKIRLDYAYKDYTIPDVITVKVQTLEEGIKDVVVEVENRAIVKPFLGGFVDKTTKVEYHHGYSQTGPRKPKVPPEMQSHRDTQTYFWRNRKLDMEYAQATQMANEDIWIPSVNDKILTAKPYETADEREKRLDIEGKVRTIQRYYWAWKMKKALKELSAEYHKRLRLMIEREERERREDLERKKRDVISKVFPRTAADFSMLYAMTERWKKAEIMRITTMHCGPSRIAEFYLLLEKEIEILRAIEQLRLKLKNDRNIQKHIDFFKTIGDPWTFLCSYKDLPVQVDTLETQKGRVYRDIYRAIIKKKLDRSTRIQVLIDLKGIMQSHNCILSNELIVLIDRACELLARGFSDKDIETLQLRIESLLLHHFELPECNENVTKRYHKLAEIHMRDNLFYCQGCHKYKSIESYSLNVRMKEAKVCATCKFIDKSKEPWVDISPYRFILRKIRQTERLLQSHYSLAYILQDKDIHFIVTHIWHAHSALSECNDIYKLRLCRWDKNRDWAPWNCILLTADEAKAHLRIEELDKVYDENFLSHVFSKHALAKKHFAQSFEVEECVEGTEPKSLYEEKDDKDCKINL